MFWSKFSFSEIFGKAKHLKERESRGRVRMFEIEDFWTRHQKSFGKITPPLRRGSFKGFLVVIFLTLAVLGGRLFYLQMVRADHLQALAWQARTRIELVLAPRGIIYDRFQRPLVSNQISFSLVAIPNLLPRESESLEKNLQEVASLLNEDMETLREKLQDIPWLSYEPQVIKAHLTKEERLLLETSLTELKGFQLKKGFYRVYPGGKVFSHILGYMGKSLVSEMQEGVVWFPGDIQGKTGIEHSYEEYLQGIRGRQEIEISSTGEKKRERLIVRPKAGQDIILTIDSELQEKIYWSLQSAFKKIKAQGAAAVALDPRDGKVLALVNLPSFDNNLFSKALSQEEYLSFSQHAQKPFFNRAVSGQYAPGSTVKPLIAVAGLEEGLITPGFKIFDLGQISVPSRYQPQVLYTFKDWKAHGWVDLKKALAESCNVYFYILGGGYQGRAGLGISRINKYLRLFGLGQKLGLDLPGEASGFLPTPSWKKKTKQELWYLGDTYHVAIGQGDLEVTPLQVASYTGALANGGTLYQPHLLEKVVGQESFQAHVIRQNFISPEAILAVQEGMRQTVVGGLLRSLADLPVSVAGKTGTAQVGNGKFHNWVTVFAPHENPRLVLTVLLEQTPQGRGSPAVASVAKEVLLWYFKDKR